MKVPSTSDGRSALQVATGAAHAAGRIILERFSEPMKVSYKGVGQGDVVTDVDLATDRTLEALWRMDQVGNVRDVTRPALG